MHGISAGAEASDRLLHSIRATAREVELAPFPMIALRVLEAAEDPEADLSKIVVQDPAISASILRVVNSALFSHGDSSWNVRSAITHLGSRSVAQLAAGIAARALFEQGTIEERRLFGAHLDACFHQSMTVALTAGWLAQHKKLARADRVFAAAMFHDVGRMLGLRALARIVVRGDEPMPDEAEIDRLLEAVHVPLGTGALIDWQLPSGFVRVAAHHHDPDLPAEFLDVHLIRLVSSLNWLRIGARRPSAADEIRDSLRVLQLPSRTFLLIGDRLRGFADEVSTVYRL